MVSVHHDILQEVSPGSSFTLNYQNKKILHGLELVRLRPTQLVLCVTIFLQMPTCTATFLALNGLYATNDKKH